MSNSRTNIVKILSNEQKQTVYQEFLKQQYASKKAFAKEVGISVRTLGRVIKEMEKLSSVMIQDVYDYTVTKCQITLFKNEESRSVVKGYPKFNVIKEALIKQDFSDTSLQEVYTLLNLPDFVAKFSEGEITVDHENSKVWYGDFEIKNSICTQMMKMLSKQEDIHPLVRFLEKLLMNPKTNVVEELYSFLQHNDIEINEEGNILAYRSITYDFKDHHTKTMDNSIGKVVTMPRTLVDDNPNQTCSSGLHVAAYGYAKDFGSNSRIVLVEVNPTDVVSVPTDYSGMKMRTCKFKVLKEVV